MGKEEFAQLLETMLNDGEAAGRVAEGDFTDLADGELTESERALLTAAGSELDDDVTGFAIFVKLGDFSPPTTGLKWENIKSERPNLAGALDYINLGDIKGE